MFLNIGVLFTQLVPTELVFQCSNFCPSNFYPAKVNFLPNSLSPTKGGTAWSTFPSLLGSRNSWFSAIDLQQESKVSPSPRWKQHGTSSPSERQAKEGMAGDRIMHACPALWEQQLRRSKRNTRALLQRDILSNSGHQAGGQTVLPNVHVCL